MSKQQWVDEYEAWKRRDLSEHRYAYVWMDGVYFRIRLEEDRLACIVVVGVREDGTKEILALEDGYRESTESWLSLWRDLKARGLQAPLLAVGDGALGAWSALRQVYPSTQHQRCCRTAAVRVHKIANVLDKPPKRLQPKAKRLLHAMMYAESREVIEEERQRFEREFGAKYPKAVDCLDKDWEQLLTFLQFPADHWYHLRSTNVIESLFATVKHRTRTTRGAGSRTAGLSMAFKLCEVAQQHWRRIRAPHRLADLWNNVSFEDGQEVTPTNTQRYAA